jgi:hypothetical protein
MKQPEATTSTAVENTDPKAALDSFFGNKPNPKAAFPLKVGVNVKPVVKSADMATSVPKLVFPVPAVKALRH